MRLSSPIVLVSLLLVLACKQDNNDTTAADTSTTAADTTDATPTTSVIDPSTTTTGVTPTTTGDTTGVGESSTGEPVEACITYTDENACAGDERCKWASVFSYAHGVDGCQGDITEVCVAKQTGQPSTWYRGENGDYEVLGFDYLPDDLPPEWTKCDCDGPLACLCAFDAPECPDRIADFCGATTSKSPCNNSVINGEFVCNYFTIYPNGPIDGECTTQPNYKKCLPADTAGSNECTKILYSQYDMNVCNVAINPAFWRESNGTFEILTTCGPTPPSPEWSPCTADDPEQPEDCKCACTEAL